MEAIDLSASHKLVSSLRRQDGGVTPDFLDTDKASEYLGVAAQTLKNWRSSRKHGPAFIRVGGRVFYLQSDLAEYLRQRRVPAITA